MLHISDRVETPHKTPRPKHDTANPGKGSLLGLASPTHTTQVGVAGRTRFITPPAKIINTSYSLGDANMGIYRFHDDFILSYLRPLVLLVVCSPNPYYY